MKKNAISSAKLTGWSRKVANLLQPPFLAQVPNVSFFAAFISLAAIGPWKPSSLTSGLDPSWVMGIGVAQSNGLRFGEDLVFTYGPLASLSTHFFDERQDTLLLLVAIVLSISFGISISALAKTWAKGRLFSLVASFLFVATAYRLDSTYLGLLFLIGLVAIWDLRSVLSLPRHLLFLWLSPLGILPLVKGSFMVPSLAVVSVLLVLAWLNKQKSLALVSAASPTFFLALAWVLTGGGLVDLGKYALGMIPIISGYSEAMASFGRAEEVVAYLLCCLVLAAAMLFNTQYSKIQSFQMVLYVEGFLFLAFKAGFVRHDGHAMTAATFLIFATFVLFPRFRASVATPVTLLVCLVALSIDVSYRPMTISSVSQRMTEPFADMMSGMASRILAPDELAAKHKVATNSIPGQLNVSERITVDIYSYDQALLLAGTRSWRPRPVFQSYSAYTEKLQALNYESLIGPDAPKVIFYKSETIDNRFPTLDDGRGLIGLLSRYEMVGEEMGYLVLQRRDSFKESNLLVVKKETAKLGQEVKLPNPESLTFIKIKANKTALGKFAEMLFKINPLTISVTLEDKRVLSYRLVSGMAESGFLLSPLLEETSSYVPLFAGLDKTMLPEIISLKVESSGLGSQFWQKDIAFEFSTPTGISAGG